MCFECLINIGVLVSSSELSVLNVSLAVSPVSWLCFCSNLELSACSLARFLRSGLLMYWLTDLGVSSWSTWLLERPVFWFDLCIVSIDSSLSVMAPLLGVESNGCLSFLTSWSFSTCVLWHNLIELLGLDSFCLSLCSACRLVDVATSKSLWEWRALSSPWAWILVATITTLGCRLMCRRHTRVRHVCIES